MPDDLRPEPQTAGVRPTDHRETKDGAARDSASVAAFIECAARRRAEQRTTALDFPMLKRESPGLETQAGREAERELDGKGPPTPASTTAGD